MLEEEVLLDMIFLFVNKNSLIIECDYNYDDAIMTGSDHALIEAYIKI